MVKTHWIEIGRMDELGRMDTPAHRLDARAKAIITIVFIATVMSFPRHELSALTPFLVYPVMLLSLGRIPFRHIAGKILVVAPFALAVAVCNPLLDREPAVIVGTSVITGGWLSFASIMLRFLLTVLAALALVACTGMHRLGAGLEQLGVPRVFVVQLLFLYRYLFVIAGEGEKMIRAVALRSTGVLPVPFRVRASLLGNLLLRSVDRAERIHLAMAARGFDGNIRTMQRTSFRPSDWAFVVGWGSFFVVARRWNLAAIVGSLLTGYQP